MWVRGNSWTFFTSLLGDLPGVGFMFRKSITRDNKRELLIFITPKIVGSELVRR